jgi:hypothetical protein
MLAKFFAPTPVFDLVVRGSRGQASGDAAGIWRECGSDSDTVNNRRYSSSFRQSMIGNKPW